MPSPMPDVLPVEETEVAPPRRQPPYAVVLHNDDRNGMEFVVIVLRKVFGYSVERCVELMLKAHEKGRTAVWTGMLEVAELKADQVISCGGDPQGVGGKADPLRVTVEPMP